MMAGVWARLLLLVAGWAAAGVIALLAGALLDVPTLPVLFTGGVIWTWLLLSMNLYALRQGQRSRHRRPSRIANPPTRGYACEASMAGHRAATAAFPNTGYSPAKRLLAYFAARGISLQGKQPAVPGRVILRPFMPIKLKKAPPGLAPRFPSEIRTAQAPIKFVNSLDPKTRAKLHWKLAASWNWSQSH
jgi:hypothetical protein